MKKKTGKFYILLQISYGCIDFCDYSCSGIVAG